MSVRREPPLAYYHDDDDATHIIAYLQVAKIVERESKCEDDHIDGWHVNEVIEFSDTPDVQEIDGWVQGYQEAEQEVIELRRSGHARARGILDAPNEMAFTCDACGLWSFVSHKVKNESDSQEERHGPLFDVRDCDKKNRRRIHGRRISANDVWMGEKPDYTPIVSGSDNRTNRDRKEYERKRSEKRRLEREANRERVATHRARMREIGLPGQPGKRVKYSELTEEQKDNRRAASRKYWPKYAAKKKEENRETTTS